MYGTGIQGFSKATQESDRQLTEGLLHEKELYDGQLRLQPRLSTTLGESGRCEASAKLAGPGERMSTSATPEARSSLCSAASPPAAGGQYAGAPSDAVHQRRVRRASCAHSDAAVREEALQGGHASLGHRLHRLPHRARRLRQASRGLAPAASPGTAGQEGHRAM